MSSQLLQMSAEHYKTPPINCGEKLVIGDFPSRASPMVLQQNISDCYSILPPVGWKLRRQLYQRIQPGMSVTLLQSTLIGRFPTCLQGFNCRSFHSKMYWDGAEVQLHAVILKKVFGLHNGLTTGPILRHDSQQLLCNIWQNKMLHLAMNPTSYSWW